MATVRFLLSYDYALSPNVTVGGRGGFALEGAPEGFLPVHAEGRVTYWFGRDALTGSVRPHAFAGAGVAEVGAPVEVAVHSRNLSTDEVTSQSVQAWGGFGFLFLAGGGGLSLALADVLAVNLDLSAMLTFPYSTLVLEPTAGLVLGI